MKKIKVKKVRKLITLHPTLVRENAPLDQVAKDLISDPKTRAVYVVDEERHLKGIITLESIMKYAFRHHLGVESVHPPVKFLTAQKAEEIMVPPIYAKEEDNLEEVLGEMLKHELEELPVVDDDLKVIGDLNMLEILSIWEEK